MIVKNNIVLKVDELSNPQWEELFRGLRYFDKSDNEYTPWAMIANRVMIPRGAWALLPDDIVYHDHRNSPTQEVLKLGIIPYTAQKKAVREMFAQEQGQIISQPGSGKTEIALTFAAYCKTPSLVLVHTRDILDQWVERCKATLPGAKIGVIAGSHKTYGHVTVAMVQTVERYIDNEKWWRRFGCLLIDEGHHSPAGTWERIIEASPCKYRFLFTATKRRADGRTKAMSNLVGPVIYEREFEAEVETKVVIAESRFKCKYPGPWYYSKAITKMVRDNDRNEKIAKIADREIAEGHLVLILSRRIEHLTNIRDCMIDKKGARILQASTLNRKKLLDDFRAGKIRCVLATQLADEALDIRRLDRIILAHPGKAEGRIIQQIGRAIRLHADKEDAVIYDICDPRMAVFRKQMSERIFIYKRLSNVTIEQEVSDNEKVRKLLGKHTIQGNVSRLSVGRLRSRS